MPETAELERRLDLLREKIEWPATPALAGRVRAGITAAAPAPRPWFQSRWALAAAILLLAIAALLAYTPARATIAHWLNLHTTISRQGQVPTPSPQPSGALGTRLGLGEQITLTQAQSQVGWQIVVPASLGQPDEVYLLLPPIGPPQGEVTLVYTSRPGIKTSAQTGVAVLVTEANGKVDAQFFGKIIGNGTTLEDVTVKGHEGYWIAGRPHDFFFTDADGKFRDETLRLATNTLILDDNGIIVRIEGDLTKAQALEIAGSLS